MTGVAIIGAGRLGTSLGRALVCVCQSQSPTAQIDTDRSHGERDSAFLRHQLPDGLLTPQ